MADIQEKLKKLRNAFVLELPSRWAAAQEQWRHTEIKDKSALYDLHRILHSLIGSSGTFGFHDLSQKLRETEQKLLAHKETGLPADKFETIAQDFDALSAMVAAVCHEQSPEQQQEEKQPSEAGQMQDIDSSGAKPVTFWLGTNCDETRHIIQDLQRDGYQTRFCDSIENLKASGKTGRPALVIIDSDAIGKPSFTGIISEIKRTCVPVLVISSEDSFQDRLIAVRAGAGGFLSKPVDREHLKRQIRKTINWPPARAGRILLVDDQPSVANFFGTVLSSGNIDVKAETDSTKLFDHLASFDPDMIILDLQMPNVDGTEIAAILGQHEKYYSIPILFLSAEPHSAKRKNELLELGATDLLPKDMKPEDFLGHVSARLSQVRSK